MRERAAEPGQVAASAEERTREPRKAPGRPLRVAMLTTVGDRCGIAAYARALCDGLRALPEIVVETVPITVGRQSTEHYREQAARLNAADIDVVHIQHEHSFWGGILPRKSAYWELRYLIRKPITLTAHTTYSLAQMLCIDTERRPHKWLVKQLLLRNAPYRDSVETAPFATAVTIVHTAAARQELAARGANPAHLFVLPAGVPPPQSVSDGGQAFRARFGLHERRVVTLFGYVAPNKGYELTLEILPSLPEDVVFLIAGGPRNRDMEPYAAQVGAAIARHGLQSRVVRTGYLSETELAEALEASDVVVAPHLQATGSYSVTLPLAHGKPIVASDLDCFREIMARADCLELFRVGNAEDYRVTLLRVLGDPARQAVLAEGARNYARRFSWAQIAAQTRDIYRSTITLFHSGPRHGPGFTGSIRPA